MRPIPEGLSFAVGSPYGGVFFILRFTVKKK